MFKHLEIRLSEPICSCDESNLSWGIQFEENDNYALIIQCETCQTSVHVPDKKLQASFHLDREYPAKLRKKLESVKESVKESITSKQVSVSPSLKILDGGKVIRMTIEKKNETPGDSSEDPEPE